MDLTLRAYHVGKLQTIVLLLPAWWCVSSSLKTHVKPTMLVLIPNAAPACLLS